MSRSFHCPYLNADVELSDEREQHIIERHPGTLPDYSVQLAEALSNPDQIRRSTRDSKSLLFSKWFETIRKGRYLVVVTISDNDHTGLSQLIQPVDFQEVTKYGRPTFSLSLRSRGRYFIHRSVPSLR